VAQESDDPLLGLWASLGRALAPFAVPVGPEVLALWRDQWGNGAGVFWAAERGDTAPIDEVIAILRELRGPDPETKDPGAG